MKEKKQYEIYLSDTWHDGIQHGVVSKYVGKTYAVSPAAAIRNVMYRIGAKCKFWTESYSHVSVDHEFFAVPFGTHVDLSHQYDW